MKPKLTPTFNDLAADARGNGHMPLLGIQQPVLPSFPLNPAVIDPPKTKGRPKKVAEQKVNLAPTPNKVPLKIACIGTAPSSRMLAPYNDPSWKIWSCSPGNMSVVPRFDAWFEIHGQRLMWPENKHYGEPYIKWLNEVAEKVPVYMQNSALVPKATEFPMAEMVKQFGPYFFTSSFAWMMALAISQGADEVALYGIDMASRDEYIIQRPGAYYYMIRGAERGCKVWAPYESDIMQPPGLYGYSDVNPFLRKALARQVEVKGRADALAQQIAQLSAQKAHLDGALEDLDYFISIQGGAQDNASTEYLNELIQQAKLTQNSN